MFGLLHIPQEKIIDRLYLKKPQSDTIVLIAIDDASLTAIGQWPWPRTIFAKVLSKLSHPERVGIDINFSEPSRLGDHDDTILAQALATSTFPIVLPIEINAKGNVTTEPLALFQVHTQKGFVNVPLDGDSIARKGFTKLAGYSSFAYVVSGNFPTAPQAFRIDYRGAEDTYLTLSLVDVLDDKIPPRIFDNKIVLIGVTAQSLHDTVETPFGTLPGVFVHAASIGSLSEPMHYTDLAQWFSALIIICIIAGIFLIVQNIKKLPVLIPALVFVLITIIVASALLFAHYTVAPILYFLIAYGIAVGLSVLFEFVRESKEKRFIRKTFQYYLSADVIEVLTRNPEKLVLGGEMRNVTILFSDVRGFTTISEAMTPEQLTSFMSDYFTGISDIVMDKRGVIDKYIGDAIMAFWGAPLDNPAHPADACRAALAINEKLQLDNQRWQAKGLPPIEIGIGINTGNVVVGNMGSHKRFNYTVIGDDVNFTSRLEGLNKEYGTTCIISETTKTEIEHEKDMFARELDEVIVKGKKTPKKIFELLKAPLSQEDIELLKYFAAGRAHYKQGEWDAAILAFKKALAIRDDGPSLAFIQRCQKFKSKHPENWNGIYEFTSK